MNRSSELVTARQPARMIESLAKTLSSGGLKSVVGNRRCQKSIKIKSKVLPVRLDLRDNLC